MDPLNNVDVDVEEVNLFTQYLSISKHFRTSTKSSSPVFIFHLK